MRKVLWAGALALMALATAPGESLAWGRDAYNSHGYGWLGSKAFRKFQWIHQNGPLFNYGPYDGPGHQEMNVKGPMHGVYIPGNPHIGSGYAGAVPYVFAPGYGPQAAQVAHYPIVPAIVPANYTVYPAWLTGR